MAFIRHFKVEFKRKNDYNTIYILNIVTVLILNTSLLASAFLNMLFSKLCTSLMRRRFRNNKEN